MHSRIMQMRLNTFKASLSTCLLAPWKKQSPQMTKTWSVSLLRTNDQPEIQAVHIQGVLIRQKGPELIMKDNFNRNHISIHIVSTHCITIN